MSFIGASQITRVKIAPGLRVLRFGPLTTSTVATTSIISFPVSADNDIYDVSGTVTVHNTVAGTYSAYSFDHYMFYRKRGVTVRIPGTLTKKSSAEAANDIVDLSVFTPNVIYLTITPSDPETRVVIGVMHVNAGPAST